MLQPGETFDRYTIEAFLGEGGMGRVYRALDTRLHRRVALKIVGVEADSTPEVRSEGIARLIREARAAAVLEHVNSVAIYDVGEQAGVAYIAMELVVGRTLRAYVGDGSVPWDERLRWLVDVARALAAAHRAGLVHRDVKPENVMVREDGVVKVLDFGVARRASSEIDVTGPTQGQIPTITGKGVVIGTPVYMSPEQMRGVPVDGRSDQFAWGVLAYELLTGRRPWPDRPNALAMAATILSEAPTPLAEAAAGSVPPVVESVVHRALRRTPEERFAAMDDVIAELEPLCHTAHRAGHPHASSRPAPSAPRTDPPASANGGVSDTRTTRRGLATSHRPDDTARRFVPRRHRRLLAVAIAIVVAVVGVASWRRRAVHTVANPVVVGGPKRAPSSTDPAAARPYDEGVQALWDGSTAVAVRRLGDAVAVDPRLAAAYLRLALATFESDPSASRAHYRSAFEHRATLDVTDTALLDAAEAYVREPSDLAEWERRLASASARFPNDAELVYWLGYARQQRNNFEDAADAFQRATRIDPHFALAWWSRGSVKYLQGDVPAALSSYDDCLKMAPQATVCLEERAHVYRREGDCAKMEAEAKAAIAKEPEGAAAYAYLAEALYARGKPLDTVREALQRVVERLPPAERGDRELFYKATTASLSGDFNAAEHFAREREKLILDKNDRAEHFGVAALLAEIYVESGRMHEAAKVAEEYLDRQDLWIGFTNPLVFQSILYRAGQLDAPAFEAKRAEWLATQQEEIRLRREGKAGQMRDRALPWIDGYAHLVQTKEEASAALSLLPVYLPLPPPTRRNVEREMDLGKVRVLVADNDGALFHLKRAVAQCSALEQPSAHTRAHYYLGLAHEALGAKAEACAAYAVVLARWGDAKPASVTAQAARDRARALACAK